MKPERITNKTIKPILKMLRQHQDECIPLTSIAVVVNRSLRSIQRHTDRGYLMKYYATYNQRRRYVVTLHDFIGYIKRYWRIADNGELIFKRRRRKQ